MLRKGNTWAPFSGFRFFVEDVFRFYFQRDDVSLAQSLNCAKTINCAKTLNCANLVVCGPRTRKIKSRGEKWGFPKNPRGRTDNFVLGIVHLLRQMLLFRW